MLQIFPMCRMEICIKLGLKPNFFMFSSQSINVLPFLRPCTNSTIQFQLFKYGIIQIIWSNWALVQEPESTKLSSWSQPSTKLLDQLGLYPVSSSSLELNAIAGGCPPLPGIGLIATYEKDKLNLFEIGEYHQ